MNLQPLEEFLDNNVIPKIKKQPKTFLGIAKQPHYENVMSNIYAFYFNAEEVHGMTDLFIASLLEIINESELGKTKQINQISDFEIETEVSTKKNGRIDLLLSNQFHAIIIENKVYHTLNNDLEDYWASINVEGDIAENKIGIVLSLNRLTTRHRHFINITHLEFLKRVILNSGSYLMDAKDKYLTYLKDFYQNIINLSKSEMESKDLKFYFDNQAKIIDLKNFHFAVREHIYNQVEAAITLIDEDLNLQKTKGEGAKRLRYFLSAKNSNLMFTILFEGLLTNERSLYIIVELKNDLLKNKQTYHTISFTEEEKKIMNSDFYSDKKTTWCHFANKKYILNEENVSSLTQFIIEKLNDDHFLSIFRKLNDFITKQQ